MNILIAPDSFKGSLSSDEVCCYISRGIKKVFPDAICTSIPMADGGEGSMQTIINNKKGKLIEVVTHNPLGKEITAQLGIFDNNKCIIEVASAIGLPLVQKQERNIMKSSSFGVGELIKKALDLHCKDIYIALGGSATNDGGVGLAQALGVSFVDQNNNEIAFGPENINSIVSIDMKKIDSRLLNTNIIVMCDVNNPLCGENGASFIYGAQKGATPQQIKILDNSLSHLVSVCKKFKINTFENLPGSGAAGGIGFALTTFFNAKLASGIETMMDLVQFNDKLENIDLIITGEGRIDEQSIHGKVPTGIALRAKNYKIPTVAIVGCIGNNSHLVYNYSISSMECCITSPTTIDEAIHNAKNNIENASERLMRSIKLGINIAKKK